MAVLFNSYSEEEEFIGFTIEPGFERNNPESESDISVSSVDEEDLSDLDLSDQESGTNISGTVNAYIWRHLPQLCLPGEPNECQPSQWAISAIFLGSPLTNTSLSNCLCPHSSHRCPDFISTNNVPTQTAFVQ